MQVLGTVRVFSLSPGENRAAPEREFDGSKTMSVYKKLLPSFIYKPLAIYRRHQRQLKVDDRLTSSHAGMDLAQITAACILLPDRVELLHRLPKGGIVAEVGVAQGDFSGRIWQENAPKVLHLIDYWSGAASESGKVGAVTDYERVQHRFAAGLANGQIKLHRGWSWEELAKFPDNTFDWIYIDAAHDYESVAKDLVAAMGKIKSEGYICGHDYTRWGSSGLSRFGVVEAVNEFCMQHGWRLAFLTNEPSRHISYALCRVG